jgi:hypothetical protein
MHLISGTVSNPRNDIHQSLSWTEKIGCSHHQQRLVEVRAIVGALGPEVGDAVWPAVAVLIPPADRAAMARGAVRSEPGNEMGTVCPLG